MMDTESLDFLLQETYVSEDALDASIKDLHSEADVRGCDPCEIRNLDGSLVLSELFAAKAKILYARSLLLEMKGQTIG